MYQLLQTKLLKYALKKLTVKIQLRFGRGNMQFYNKIIEALNTNKSSVCVGLDSDIRKIPESLRNDTNPLWKFNKEIIDATKEVVIAYKLNYAFYLSAGSKGLEALEKTLDYIPSNIPVILDVKCGDIGNTMEHY